MSRRPALATLAVAAFAACAPAPAPTAPAIASSSPPASVTLGSLSEGRTERGFVPLARYVDGDGRFRGARFAHAKTGFLLDYLAIETAPQAFVYVTTYPTSDRGEPHTQEHLLLGRGNKGRSLGNFEHTSLVRSSAFTAQYRTAYHFHTVAGADTFWDVLPRELDALLHGDYSDEEIRREVRDFGVATGKDGKLRLEEKGTVYNEMVRSYEEPDRLAYLELMRMVFGANHPLAFSSGGTPDGIRELTPAIIRAFHTAHYRLDNMGMIVALPEAVPLDVALERIGATLEPLAATDAPAVPIVRETDLPAANGAAAGSVMVVSFPHASADHPGLVRFAWPAARSLHPDDRILLEVFMAAFAGGPGSRLYTALVDQRTRKLDTGATSVWGDVAREPGQVVSVGLSNVRASLADEATSARLRELIRAELDRVAGLEDGSKELAELGGRVKARIAERRRSLDKMLDTPPEFGTRGTYDEWLDWLTDVQADPGFDKSLVRKSAFAKAEAVAAQSSNGWRARIHAWKLDDVPYAVAARPSPALRSELDAAREARTHAEMARLWTRYGTSDAQAALARRKAEIDHADQEIARAEAEVPMPPLTTSPPMSDDDLLSFREEKLGGVPFVVSTFDTMKSVTIGLALRLDTVPPLLLPYVAVLPSLMSDVGVIREGVPIPYDEVRDRLRREVLGVHVHASTSFATGRAELFVVAQGNDAEEARRALGWAKDFLTSPDLRPENLARIKDVVAERIAELGDVMAGPEEHWVERVEEAYWRQESPLLAHAGSFLTRAHDAMRVSWKLEGGGERILAFLGELAGAGKAASRPKLASLAASLASLDAPAVSAKGQATRSAPGPLERFVASARRLPEADRARVRKVGRDLGRMLGDLPDASLATDWAAACKEMAAEMTPSPAVGRGPAADAPAAALRGALDTLASIRHTGNARVWMVGSTANEASLTPDVASLIAALDPAPAPRVAYPSAEHVLSRARSRGARVADPAFVALVNASTANGALVASADMYPYDDPSDAAMDLYLGANVLSGTGAHSLYKRIWGAGLAYSGYTWASPRYGRYEIYADRCADLASLLRFLDEQVRDAPGGPTMVEYAAARAFGARVADTYESRAASIAADLVDGFPPSRVRAFRERVLGARKRPGIGDAVHRATLSAFGALLPSASGANPARTRASLHVVVGPEAQIAATEKAVAPSGKEGFSIARLYPRDFWYVAP